MSNRDSYIERPHLADSAPHEDDHADENTRMLPGNNSSSNDNRTPPVSARIKAESKGLSPQTTLIIIVCAMVLSNSINYVLYVRLAGDMREYTWFLASVAIPLAFLAVCWPVVWYKMLFTDQITKEMRAIPARYFVICGLFDFLGNLLGTIPAPYVPGPVQVVLSQVVLPVNMTIAYVYLRMRYKLTHYLGVMFIIIGVIVASHSTLEGTTKVYWLLILMSATIPAAFSNIFKEKGLKDLDLDVWYFNAWVSLYQLLLGMVTVPFVFVPVLCGREKPIPPAELGYYLGDGATCFFGTNVNGSENCGETPYVFIVFLAFNVLFNILLMLVFKHGSSTLAVVASALRVALSAFGFNIPFLAGAAFQKIDAYHIAALFILVVGLVFYQWNKEMVADPKDPDPFLQVGGSYRKNGLFINNSVAKSYTDDPYNVPSGAAIMADEEQPSPEDQEKRRQDAL